ncbi:OVARIAN TUMOR DOMAIN-containing deubiquitinating enzyme 4-like [Argentina anserina]|uniref:OVARIAN TUMOR DOMAIN-containing deubiquitinating enzyme 4-like n=1 Tax=Argentina anserina TaxID=57926 RepID=UPI002176913C|nr:OVARIAN TUMOR DOMAIN-containing deubiquitinating enzyme 4-like [Potentilla anserina]XP_050381567.1 OVARIAN TUMOR DOMAIN-containing deubiquitinating enzyme 4-like [Potentilla anserina]XP_050381568.1 OVARIAN TUMOR DOMAIN-containing deubiquitinating enzyme 4-like [Potentilla anserina]XP_050381570.1 OVARIAN TUMOR DOMAIN-containing deubiquitinating enzyme 4-like [Potentilla anserina]
MKVNLDYQGYVNTIVCAHINQASKNVVCMSGYIQMQMGSKICSVVSRGTSSSCCYRPGRSVNKLSSFSLLKSRPFGIGQMPHGSCFRSCFSMDVGNSRSLTVNARGTQKQCLDISLAYQGMKMRISTPRQGMFPKIKCNVGPVSWPHGCASAGLMFGLLICNSSEPLYAEAAYKNVDEEDDDDLSYSHGKKVHTDYSIIGIPGDGRCLFRSVAHGACLRAGKQAPSQSLQKELADDLRARVADEFIKRREETEWFVEGDFDTYVSQIREPHVWGGEPELLMASHVLRMPITVYMHDENAGGLITIAEYGQEYGKENPIRVLYHGFGHYDALHIPGVRSGKSRL